MDDRGASLRPEERAAWHDLERRLTSAGGDTHRRRARRDCNRVAVLLVVVVLVIAGLALFLNMATAGIVGAVGLVAVIVGTVSRGTGTART